MAISTVRQINSAVRLNGIDEILTEFRAGRFVILVDDESRENEGDLVIAAECVTPEHVNFMATHARGLICLTLSEERCQQLGLALMVQNNNARYSTNFTVSIEASQGVTTGISAADRAMTVQAAVKPDASPKDIITPGHIFPVMAQPGGVLTRAGHTEAGVDLARLCGFEPASAICEVLNDDGSMARVPDLLEFGNQHDIKIGTIADIIKHRLQNESTVRRGTRSTVNTRFGEFNAVIYEDIVSGNSHLALVRGSIEREQPTLVRVHLHYGLYDILAEARGDHTWPVNDALEAISKQNSGVVVLLDYNDGEETLLNHIHASHRQDDDDTPDRNSSGDLRVLGAGSQILADLGVGKMRVLGTPRKAHALSGFDLEIVDYVSDKQNV